MGTAANGFRVFGAHDGLKLRNVSPAGAVAVRTVGIAPPGAFVGAAGLEVSAEFADRGKELEVGCKNRFDGSLKAQLADFVKELAVFGEDGSSFLVEGPVSYQGIDQLGEAFVGFWFRHFLISRNGRAGLWHSG